MRSKLFFLAAVTLVGCSEDAPTTPVVVEDAIAETIGIDTSTTVDSSGPDTETVDSTALETAVDSGSDTRMDAAPDVRDSMVVVDTSTTVDSAADTSVTDAAFALAPVCDGTVGTAEYGVHIDGRNQYTSTGASNVWHVTWDDTSLYIAISNANVAEAAVVYVDANPVSPASGGTNADGNLAGYAYDSTKLATLPFRANLVAYAKSGYRELRTADGAGGWSSETTSFGCFASSGTTRELSIPWSALGGRPSSFGFLGYVTSGGGFVYGEVPNANPDGAIGTTATATKYFHVGATGPTATTSAFADER